MKFSTDILGALRTAALTILICCAAYTSVIWVIGQVFLPGRADGSLKQNIAGKYVGSRLVGQRFFSEKYFHSRPSKIEYDGTKSAGSNLSPTSPELTGRARKIIEKYEAGKSNPLPLDMVTASGSGLDPHITLAAAEYQIPRVARARAINEKVLAEIVTSHIEYPGGIMRNEPMVNVLMLNLALDEQKQRK